MNSDDKTTLFRFQLPEWVNSGQHAETAEQALNRAREAAQVYYACGVQTGVHAMIEWCGVMVEHVRMLEIAAQAGMDPREVDKHHGTAVEVLDFMVAYLCEKLGCQFTPFINANPAAWRREIDKWFAEEKHPHE